MTLKWKARPPPRPQLRQPPKPHSSAAEHGGEGDSERESDDEVLGSFISNDKLAEMNGGLPELWNDYYTNIHPDDNDGGDPMQTSDVSDIDEFLKRANRSDCLGFLDNSEHEENANANDDADGYNSLQSDNSENDLLMDMDFSTSPRKCSVTEYVSLEDVSPQNSPRKVHFGDTPRLTYAAGRTESHTPVPVSNRHPPESYEEYIDWLNMQILPTPSLEVMSLSADSSSVYSLDPDWTVDGLHYDVDDDYRLTTPSESGRSTDRLTDIISSTPDGQSVRGIRDGHPLIDSPTRRCASDGRLERLLNKGCGRTSRRDRGCVSLRGQRNVLLEVRRHASMGQQSHDYQRPRQRRFCGIRRDSVSRLERAGQGTYRGTGGGNIIENPRVDTLDYDHTDTGR